MNRDIVDMVTERVRQRLLSERLIPVEASARHVHLSREHVDMLFGRGYELKEKRELSQPGQYQCCERIKLIGPRGVIDGVAVLGPVRSRTQVELALTDSITLGIVPPVRESGDLEGSAAVFIASEKAVILAEESVIIAKRHIHMKPVDALRFGVHDGQEVHVRVLGQRPLVFEEVLVRISEAYSLALHVDFDEANACGYTEGTVCTIC